MSKIRSIVILYTKTILEAAYSYIVENLFNYTIYHKTTQPIPTTKKISKINNPRAPFPSTSTHQTSLFISSCSLSILCLHGTAPTNQNNTPPNHQKAHPTRHPQQPQQTASELLRAEYQEYYSEQDVSAFLDVGVFLPGYVNA